MGDPDVPVPEGPVPDLPDEVEPRRYPSTIGGAFYILILLAAASGIGVAMIHDWRLGIRVFAVALLAAAVVRLVLPQRDAGMLAVRHRLIDVGMLTAVGLTLYFLAGSIPDLPA